MGSIENVSYILFTQVSSPPTVSPSGLKWVYTVAFAFVQDLGTEHLFLGKTLYEPLPKLWFPGTQCL